MEWKMFDVGKVKFRGKVGISRAKNKNPLFIKH